MKTKVQKFLMDLYAEVEEHREVLRGRLSSLAEQYENLNELAAQAPLAIASMTTPAQVDDPYKDEFYDSELIHEQLESIAKDHVELKAQFEVDSRVKETTESTLTSVKQAFNKPQLGIVSPEPVNVQKTASGSMRRRKPAADAARRAKKDEVTSKTPIGLPVFPGFNQMGKVASAPLRSQQHANNRPGKARPVKVEEYEEEVKEEQDKDRAELEMLQQEMREQRKKKKALEKENEQAGVNTVKQRSKKAADASLARKPGQTRVTKRKAGEKREGTR